MSATAARRRPAAVKCTAPVDAKEHGQRAEEPGSPLSPWGSLFAIWGLDEPEHEDVRRNGSPEPVINAIMTFDYSQPALEDCLALIQTKILCHKRFCKRVKRGGKFGHPTWAPCEVDARQHVSMVTLRGPPGGADPMSSDTELHALVLKNLHTMLPEDRPPWEVHVVHYSDSPGGAMLWRIHHSIGDGISLASLLLSLADGGPPPLPGESVRGRGCQDGGLLTKVLAAAMAAASFAYNSGMSVLYAGYLLLRPDAPSAVRTEGPTYRKRCRRGLAISKEVPLADIKAVGKAADATVNEVLMTAITSAIAIYEERHGSKESGAQRLTFFMPVNIRPIKGIQADIAASAAGADAHWGNRIGPILGRLPVFGPGGRDLEPRERMVAMQRMLRPKRQSLEPVILALVIKLVTLVLGTRWTYALVDWLGSSTTTLISNVPGPQVPVLLGGHQITGICNVVNGTPQGAQFSFLSYDGGLRMATTASEDIISDPEELADLFLEGFAQLREAYGTEQGPCATHPPVDA